MKRILVVDDNEIDRTVMAQVLATAGFRVHTLPTAIGATRLAKQEKAQVVVVDQNMPSIDGNKLVSIFKENGALRNVAFVLVSGDDPAKMGRVAAAAMFVFTGVSHFILPAPMAEMVPSVFPAPMVWVIGTGVAEILGGIVARVGGKLLDGSTRSRLAALKRELTGGGGKR